MVVATTGPPLWREQAEASLMQPEKRGNLTCLVPVDGTGSPRGTVGKARRARGSLRLFQTTDAASAISQVLPTTARETIIPFHGRGGCDRAVGVSPSPQGKPEFELRTGPLLPDTTASLTGHRRGIPPPARSRGLERISRRLGIPPARRRRGVHCFPRHGLPPWGRCR